MNFSEELRRVDPEVAEAIVRELDRERTTLDLIASENFTSPAVLAAQGSILTNKYAEGYPRHRYYGGCEFVDVVEDLARERGKQLYGAEHANVQPHSGAQANLAAYFALIKPGDTVLGLHLAHGGHLTHGSRANYSGQLYDFVPYGVNKETELFDYEDILELARRHKPRLIVAGASAYPRQIDFAAFRQIADEVDAMLMVDMAHLAGLVAADVHPNPVPHCEVVTTTTHKGLRGPRSGAIFCRAEHASAIDKAVFPGIQGGPLMHVIAAKAVCFKEASTEEFREYQRRMVANAKVLANSLAERGFKLISGGTDTYLILVDLRGTSMTGRDAEVALDRAGITVNKNTVPFEKMSPSVTSGIRIGTPATTTRGMGEAEMRWVAEMIAAVLEDVTDQRRITEIRGRVRELCEAFPLYRELSEESAVGTG